MNGGEFRLCWKRGGFMEIGGIGYEVYSASVKFLKRCLGLEHGEHCKLSGDKCYTRLNSISGVGGHK